MRGIVVVAVALVASTSALSARVAVFPVVRGGAGDDGAVKVAVDVKAGLAAAGDLVVDDAALALRLRGPAGAVVDVAVSKDGVKAADEAFAALDHERSVSLLEQAIQGLEQDRDFSVEKRAVLEDARLKAAQRLLGLAGPGETGKGETKNGEAARRHLQNALKTNPTLELGKQFPPKMKALFALAQSDVDALGTGGVTVRSTPPGATVVVDGRALGLTPLTTTNALAPGSWRLWIEHDGRRSNARVVDVDKGAVVAVEIDLGFEGSFVTSPVPALSPTTPYSAASLTRLAGLVDVDTVVLVGAGDAGAVYVVAVGSGPVLEHGVAGVTDVAGVVRAVHDGVEVDGDAPADVFAPAVVAAAAPKPAAVSEGDGEFPWLGVGVGAVVVGAVVVTGAVVGAVTLLAHTTTVTYSLQEVEE